MLATLWISDRKCKVLVADSEGRIIDTDDTWNNRASAESWVYDAYPGARVKFVTDAAKIKELNSEWNSCRNGVN